MSDRQPEAKRRNGKHSSGPTTPEGKAVCSQNAVKHGLLSGEVLLPDEDEGALVELGEAIRAELKPATELERILVDRIVSSTWRLRRVLAVERDVFARTLEVSGGLEELLAETKKPGRFANGFPGEQGFSNLSRYEAAIERGLFRALDQLRILQAGRQKESVS